MISHKLECTEFAKFYRQLYKGIDDIDLMELQLDNPNLLKDRPPTISQNPKDRIVLWCCCKSHLAHRESDKFTIINKSIKASCTADSSDKTASSKNILFDTAIELESQQAVMEKRIFKKVKLGELIVEKPDFKNVAVVLRDNYPNFFPRIH